MKNHFRIYLLYSVFLLYSCSGAKMEKYEKITAKKTQPVTKRIVRNLTQEASMNITKTFNGLSLSDMQLSKTAIFARLGEQMVKLNKQDLSIDFIFRIPTGRGPGEIINFEAALFNVKKDVIAIYDLNSKKTVLYDLNGNYREEFINGGYPVTAMAMADEQTYYFKVRPLIEYLFYEVERKKNESVIGRLFQKQSDDVEILAYSGSIAYHNQSLYFAGDSEPIIRRYDLSGQKVDLVFSRAVIDDYNSENNYRKPRAVSSKSRFWGYTDEAQFASKDIVADDNYLYSVRFHNGKEGYKYLDIYTVEDGSYVGSFALRYYPEEIAVDRSHIYILELGASESVTTTYLIKYKKPEMDFKSSGEV